MKKFVPFLLAAMLVLPTLTQAKIWRVNNNAGVVADFNTLDGAMAAYAAGDTIHLEPSATAYTETGNLFNQNNGFVTIIGNGYSLSPTQNPGLQQETLSSQINSTSTEVGIKSFIKFIGIFFVTKVNLVFVSNINNISFESCLFFDIVHCDLNNTIAVLTADNIHFTKNVFASPVNLAFANGITFLANVTGFLFENNIVIGDLQLGYSNYDNFNEHIIRNNVFLGVNNGAQFAYWANNIFVNQLVFPPTSFSLGISRRNMFKTTQGLPILSFEDYYQVDMLTVFQSNQTPLQDKFFQLAAGSPAIGAGVPNGATPVDCGAFGGTNPYKLSGIPSIPAIYELSVPAFINSGIDMHINVKSRSNN